MSHVWHQARCLASLAEELQGAIHFYEAVVLIGFGSHAHLFELLLMVLLADLFFHLVLELSVVHDAADGRTFVASDLDQVHAGLACPPHRFEGFDDPDLVIVLVDQAHLRDADLLVRAVG